MRRAAQPSRTGIAARLMVAMTWVLASAALAAWVVAAAVGPMVFHRHMAAAVDEPGTLVDHAERAFTSASAATLAVALTVAVLTALLTSTVLARRIGTSLGTLSTAAQQVAAGRYEVRLGQPGIGTEFDALADAFNAMAARLSRDDDLRRRLMADVAHELRTPVATISAYLDALEDGIDELNPQTIEILRSQASRLTRLSSDLAAVTQAESGGLVLQRSSVSASDLVATAADAARSKAQRAAVTLSTRVQEHLPEPVVDPDRIGQVLANLVNNAIEHTPAGGRVVLVAERSTPGLRLRVDDTGEGITADDLPHVFERFYRVDTARDRAHGGSGIGLAIAKALVEAHGGTIAAHSDGLGRGARFVIDLPA